MPYIPIFYERSMYFALDSSRNTISRSIRVISFSTLSNYPLYSTQLHGPFPKRVPSMTACITNRFSRFLLPQMPTILAWRAAPVATSTAYQ